MSLPLMNNGYAFLHELKVLKSPDAPENAYNDMPIKKALEEMGLTAPIRTNQGTAAFHTPVLILAENIHLLLPRLTRVSRGRLPAPFPVFNSSFNLHRFCQVIQHPGNDD